MKLNYFHSAVVLLFIFFSFSSHSQSETKATPGPVFDQMGAVYDVTDADYAPSEGTTLKAIFDIDRKVDDPSRSNPLITSLHRFYNMHVRNGVDEDDIHLAFVVHGASTDHVLNDEAHRERYGVDNPNSNFIKALGEKGVKMYICGQSASYRGIRKEDLLPEVSLALSAMTVLTTFQMDGYGMIKF